MIFILNKKEVKMKKIMILNMLLFVGVANAQQQVSEKEAINAAISTLHPFQNIPPQVYEHIPRNIPKYPTRLTSAYPDTIIIGSEIIPVPDSWYTVKTGKTVEYVAHERITLMPGFKTENGARFTAKIEPCRNCP
jgi:hypothetical protein